MHVAVIIAAGGEGRRVGGPVPKQLLEIGGRSILERCVGTFLAHHRVTDIVLALPPSMAAAPPTWLPPLAPRVRVVIGGARRQDSVANAFDAIAPAADIVLVHDAARPFVSADLISRSIDAAAAHGAAIIAIRAQDTVKRVADDVVLETIPRDSIYLAQTPQAFRRDVLAAAVAAGRTGAAGTDEAALAEQAGHKVHIVDGDPANVKITTGGDLESARKQLEPSDRRAAEFRSHRVGVGYDLHKLVEGRPLVLGGVAIPWERGPLGHSDADVVCHAVTDAVLGAARAGDIGGLFPDTDPQWKDASSIRLLADAVARVRERGFEVANVDVVVILERPKLAPYCEAIEQRLADALGVDADGVSVKAKTNEGVDAVGRGEAIAAHAVAIVTPLVSRP